MLVFPRVLHSLSISFSTFIFSEPNGGSQPLKTSRSRSASLCLPPRSVPLSVSLCLMPDGASRRRSRREFHGTPGRRDLGNVVILGIVKTGLEKTLSFIVHVS
ncbi:hypothetical protein CsatB_023201 [Cannabis sativa]